MADVYKKLEILGAAAKYDASCASSGSGRAGRPGQLGNAFSAGICHTWAEDGRCVSLLKVLMGNACAYNCAYCQNRCDSDVPRAVFDPRELADLTVAFYRRNYIEGLFLSSGVIKNSAYTMEMMLKALELLRSEEYRFGGYIHVKVIPGSDPLLIERLGLLADRLSVNIELPSARSLELLAPQKPPESIFTPMRFIEYAKNRYLDDGKHCKSAPLFAPAGQSTQMIIGATPDTDRTIIKLSSQLYKRFSLKRVYYSAYIPVGTHPALPQKGTAQAPLRREHRLYQADWLMRRYGFGCDEILDGENLELEMDPKAAWALRHPERFPVEVNRAEYLDLLRVPGIGERSAKRIITARRSGKLSAEDMRKLGVVMKRAQYFITANGRYAGRLPIGHSMVRAQLEDGPATAQLSLFGDPSQPRLEERNAGILRA